MDSAAEASGVTLPACERIPGESLMLMLAEGQDTVLGEIFKEVRTLVLAL